MLPWFNNGRFPLYLAPMAGFTDTVFRQLCKEQGADVMVTEFVMADALLQESGYERLRETIDFDEDQRPMGIQIFGSDPAKMGAAAQLVKERLSPDFVDINFGCPAPKVVGNCAGSSLLKDLPLYESIIRACVDALPGFPVTVKIRTGWDDDEIVALEAGKRAEAAGAQALAIHGRTKVQGYRGDANWSVIAEVAEKLSIPVIGNGAVDGSYHVASMRAQAPVSGLMVGRAALGYPWIFRELKHELKHGEPHPEPDLKERWEVLLRYSRLLQNRPAHRWDTIRWMRPRLKAFTTKIPGGRKLRMRFDQIETLEALAAVAEEHLDQFAGATA